VSLFGPRVNADGQRHADVYVPPTADPVALRYPDGEPTGFALAASQLAYRDGRGEDGSLRLDYHERLSSPAGELVFARGGNGFVDAQNVKYGHVAVADLAADPGAPVPSGGGRGQAVKPDGSLGAHVVRVRSIPAHLHYKRPQDTRSGTNAGARWLHYGDPGADQGDRHDVHYSYLVWSFLDARGGGMVRALLREGQIVWPCAVAPIELAAYDAIGAVNGAVTGRYVAAEVADTSLYGWMAWSHRAAGAEPVAHAEPAS
jgi:hypothetical protein